MMEQIDVREVDAVTAANEMVLEANSILNGLFKMLPADDLLALEPGKFSQMQELITDSLCMMSSYMTYFVRIAKKQQEMDQKLDDIKKMLEEMKCKE